ncbi:MAG: VWA domain-containing protein [Polyangiaceae bacterium]|nr:VWA domain-containing protein [Polyangiaceae bacterium]
MKGRGLNIAIVGIFLAVCAVVIWLAMGNKGSGSGSGSAAGASSTGTAAPGAPVGPAVEIVISSSDGKKEWIEDVAKAFHESKAEVSGKPIRVQVIHMKSGESMQKILDGKEKPTLWSPAGQAWIELINQTWKGRSGQNFIDASKPTVTSGLVIAMWKPMAEALGWPGKPIGWDDLTKVAADPKGWGSYGHPEWGAFRFGHGHPDYSTSAMMSVISAIYAAAGKTSGLTPDDLKNPKVIERVGTLEKAIVHYGESSSWLTEKLCTKGPAYLSAVTLYEANVVKANDKYKAKMPFPLVAIYPKEGTFWENHPTGIVNADWVNADQKQAAQKFLDFMVSKDQQAKAPKYGYRPTDKSVPVTSPIDLEHGADPAQSSENSLEYVSDSLFRRANELWHEVKKHSVVYLVLDTSGSMNGDAMNAAKKGAAQFIREMQKEDEVAVIAFSDSPRLVKPLAKVRETGESLAAAVENLFADGGTSLYDATVMAMDLIEKHKKESKEQKLYGVVVLSDGKDTASRQRLSDLLDRMPATESADGTRIFTVAYGNEADEDLLKQISGRSNALFLKGDAGNIDKIYHQISAYF